MKKLDKEDLLNLLKGSSILSTGGGGSVEEAQKILEKLDIEEIGLADPNGLESEQKALTCYGVGSTASDDVDEIQSIDAAVEAFKSKSSESVSAVYPAEMGALALLDAIIVSKKLSVPLLNLDAADGRCVPKVEMNPLKNLQETGAPYLITHESGKTKKIDENISLKNLEEVARNLAAQEKSIVFVTGHTYSIGKISDALKTGTLDKALEIGEKADSIESLKEKTELRFITKGKITEVSVNKGNQSFFESELTIKTVESEIKLHTFNEFTKIEKDGEKIVENPEMILALDLESLNGIYTGENLENREIALFKKNPEGFWKTDEGKKMLKKMVD